MNFLKNITLHFLIFLLLVIIGCDESPSGFDYQKEVVVNGTLTTGQNIDTLKLHWTGEVDKYYDQKALAISGAIVLIKNTDGTVFDSLEYVNAGVGFYRSTNPVKIIEPTKTYSLYVKTPPPDVRIVTATVTVPDTFSIIHTSFQNNAIVKYDVFAPIHEFVWTPSRFHSTYLPTVVSLDSNAAFIPKVFYSDTTSKDFRKPEKSGYRIGLPPDQTNTVLPWVFLNYFGKTQFDIFAVDKNYGDFINQAVTAQGGELKEIRYNISGGLGLFGAKTKAKNGIIIYLVP